MKVHTRMTKRMDKEMNFMIMEIRSTKVCTKMTNGTEKELNIMIMEIRFITKVPTKMVKGMD